MSLPKDNVPLTHFNNNLVKRIRKMVAFVWRHHGCNYFMDVQMLKPRKAEIGGRLSFIHFIHRLFFNASYFYSFNQLQVKLILTIKEQEKNSAWCMHYPDKWLRTSIPITHIWACWTSHSNAMGIDMESRMDSFSLSFPYSCGTSSYLQLINFYDRRVTHSYTTHTWNVHQALELQS